MYQDLKDHLKKIVNISDDVFEQVAAPFTVQTFKKKEYLLREAQVCKAKYFVVKGILRKFFFNDKGVEYTTEFAIENWWLTDTFSFMDLTPTEFYIQAVEQTEILALGKEDF